MGTHGQRPRPLRISPRRRCAELPVRRTGSNHRTPEELRKNRVVPTFTRKRLEAPCVSAQAREHRLRRVPAHDPGVGEVRRPEHGKQRRRVLFRLRHGLDRRCIQIVVVGLERVDDFLRDAHVRERPRRDRGTRLHEWVAPRISVTRVIERSPGALQIPATSRS